MALCIVLEHITIYDLCKGATASHVELTSDSIWFEVCTLAQEYIYIDVDYVVGDYYQYNMIIEVDSDRVKEQL